jgi:hypothetical protein
MIWVWLQLVIVVNCLQLVTVVNWLQFIDGSEFQTAF